MRIDVAKCSGIELSILRAYRAKKKRGWEKIYIAVDLHDTITWSTYKRKEGASKKVFFPDAVEALRYFSSFDSITLILYTSSFADYLSDYYEQMAEKGVHFEYLNENPECPSTDTGDFSLKFYFNVLLDDKAGFNPMSDWKRIHKLIEALEKDEVKITCSKGSVEQFLDFKL